MKHTTVLLVEDDLDLARVLAGFLAENGMTVRHAARGDAALAQLRGAPCDICILDVGLPDCNGFELCKTLRQWSDCPILMLTALEREEDIIHGLQCGADDYVTKPCSLRVLHSRLVCLLRRADRAQQPPARRLFSGRLAVDPEARTVLRDGARLPLSGTEFALCCLLLQGDGRILTRDFLLAALSDAAEPIEDNTLTVYVSRLRRKLGLYEGAAYIDTVPGIGYRWNVEVRRLLQ